MRRTAVWRGLDAPRMEIARVELSGAEARVSGTQLGVSYELRYALEPGLLTLELVGSRTLEVPLDGLDFFDLGLSPLFNSLPVWRDGLLDEGAAREYVMRFVSVPDLTVTEAEQRYEPLGEGRVRFSSGDFAADLVFDDEGLVVHYEGLAERLRLSERLRLLLERAQSGYRLRDAATGEVVRWEDPRILVIPVAGVSFRPESLDDPSFEPGLPLALVPEPDNEHDPNAVAVWNEERTLQVGYVPREIAPQLTGDEQAVSLWRVEGGLRVLIVPADAWVGRPR